LSLSGGSAVAVHNEDHDAPAGADVAPTAEGLRVDPVNPGRPSRPGLAAVEGAVVDRHGGHRSASRRSPAVDADYEEEEEHSDESEREIKRCGELGGGSPGAGPECAAVTASASRPRGGAHRRCGCRRRVARLRRHCYPLARDRSGATGSAAHRDDEWSHLGGIADRPRYIEGIWRVVRRHRRTRRSPLFRSRRLGRGCPGSLAPHVVLSGVGAPLALAATASDLFLERGLVVSEYAVANGALPASLLPSGCAERADLGGTAR